MVTLGTTLLGSVTCLSEYVTDGYLENHLADYLVIAFLTFYWALYNVLHFAYCLSLAKHYDAMLRKDSTHDGPLDHVGTGEAQDEFAQKHYLPESVAGTGFALDGGNGAAEAVHAGGVQAGGETPSARAAAAQTAQYEVANYIPTAADAVKPLTRLRRIQMLGDFVSSATTTSNETVWMVKQLRYHFHRLRGWTA